VISYLKGKTKTHFDDSLILVVNNIGYRVFVNSSLVLGTSKDQELELFIHQSISENSNTLFGFMSVSELELFEQLITVSGVGPRTALSILESPTDTIKHAIISRDIALLVEFPGIGKKTAERLCVELQNKLLNLRQRSEEVKASGNIETTVEQEVKHAHSTPLCNEEAFEALQALGFSRLEAHRMISTVPSTVFETEEIVKEALKNKQ